MRLLQRPGSKSNARIDDETLYKEEIMVVDINNAMTGTTEDDPNDSDLGSPVHCDLNLNVSAFVIS